MRSASGAFVVWLPLVAERALALRQVAIGRDVVEPEPSEIELGGTLSGEVDGAAIAFCLSLMTLWVGLCAGVAYAIWHWGEEEVEWVLDPPATRRSGVSFGVSFASPHVEEEKMSRTLTTDTQRARNLEKAVLDRDVDDELAETMVARQSLVEEQQQRGRSRKIALAVVSVICVLGVLYLGLSMCVTSPYVGYGTDCPDNVLVVIDAAENQPRHVFQGSDFPALLGRTTAHGESDCHHTYKLVCAVPTARREPGSFFNGPFAMFDAMFGKGQNRAALETRHLCSKDHIDKRKVVRITDTMTVTFPAAVTLHAGRAFQGAEVKANGEDRGVTLTQVDKHVLAMQAELADAKQKLAQCESKDNRPQEMGEFIAEGTTTTRTTSGERPPGGDRLDTAATDYDAATEGARLPPVFGTDSRVGRRSGRAGRRSSRSEGAEAPSIFNSDLLNSKGGRSEDLSANGDGSNGKADADANGANGKGRPSDSSNEDESKEPDYSEESSVDEIRCFQEDLRLLHAHLSEESLSQDDHSAHPSATAASGNVVAIASALQGGGGGEAGSYPEAAKISVECDDGFTADGTPDGAVTMQSTCVKGGWSQTRLRCEPVMCDPLPLKHSGDLRISWLAEQSEEVPRWAHGAVAEAKCHPGYTLDAQPPGEGNTAIEVSCRHGTIDWKKPPGGEALAAMYATGRSWDEVGFDCQPVVCAAPVLENGVVPVTTYDAGEAEASCKAGYTLYTFAGKPSENTFMVSCAEDGAVEGLEGKTCSPVDCGDPVPLFGGSKVAWYEGETTYVPNHRSGKLYCKEGWTLSGKESGATNRSLTCSPSGVWDTIGSGVCLNTQCGGETEKVVTCPRGLSFDGMPCKSDESNCKMRTTCTLEEGWVPEPQQCRSITCPRFAKHHANVPRAIFGRAPVRGWCDDGYDVEGLPGKTSFYVTCGEDGKHRNAMKCVPVDCGDLLPAFGGDEAATFIGDTRWSLENPVVSKIQCMDGFTLTGKEGGEKEVSIQCMEGGVWSEYDRDLRCRHTECGGELTKVEKCEEGHSFDGKPCWPDQSNCYAKLTCGTSGWSPRPRTCRPIDCGRPELAPWWMEHIDFYRALFTIDKHDPTWTDNTYVGKGRELRCKWFPNRDDCLGGQINERRGLLHSDIKPKRKKWKVTIKCGADGQWVEPKQWETEQCAYPIRAKDPPSSTTVLSQLHFGILFGEEASHVLTSTGRGKRIEGVTMERYNLNQRWVVDNNKIRSAADDSLCLSPSDPKAGQTAWTEGYLYAVDCGSPGHDLTWQFSHDTEKEIRKNTPRMCNGVTPCCSLMPKASGRDRGGFPGSYYIKMPPRPERVVPSSGSRYLWEHDGSVQKLDGPKAKTGKKVGYKVDKHGRILTPFAHEKNTLDTADEAFDLVSDPWPKIQHWNWIDQGDFPLTALSFWWRGHSQELAPEVSNALLRPGPYIRL